MGPARHQGWTILALARARPGARTRPRAQIGPGPGPGLKSLTAIIFFHFPQFLHIVFSAPAHGARAPNWPNTGPKFWVN